MIAQPNSYATRFLSLIAACIVFAGCASEPVNRTEAERNANRSPAGMQTPTPDRHEFRPGRRAAQVALQQLGAPYRYGGQSPSGFDCSGLVHYSYGRAGVSVPRTTGQLWSAVATVPRADLRAGDLLFFRIDGKMSHVGMYIGNGQFVHAPSSGKVVRIESLDSPFYDRAFLRAGRL